MARQTVKCSYVVCACLSILILILGLLGAVLFALDRAAIPYISFLGTGDNPESTGVSTISDDTGNTSNDTILRASRSTDKSHLYNSDPYHEKTSNGGVFRWKNDIWKYCIGGVAALFVIALVLATLCICRKCGLRHILPCSDPDVLTIPDISIAEQQNTAEEETKPCDTQLTAANDSEHIAFPHTANGVISHQTSMDSIVTLSADQFWDRAGDSFKAKLVDKVATHVGVMCANGCSWALPPSPSDTTG